MLEYLLLGAFGFYLLIDPDDRIQPFHETVCRIHRQATGLDFPWLTFADPGELGEESHAFLGVFRPGFAEQTVNVLRSFFDR
jgi:hypothetical protein